MHHDNKHNILMPEVSVADKMIFSLFLLFAAWIFTSTNKTAVRSKIILHGSLFFINVRILEKNIF